MNWKRTLGILWVSNFFITAGMSLVIPFLSLFIMQLGVTDTNKAALWSSWVFSAQFVTSIIFQPIWGRFADKHGRKIMLLRAGIGMGVVTALMGFVTAPWQLLLLRLLNGVFSGFISMSVSLMASIAPSKEAGKALGTLQTGAIAGNLVGPLLGGVLAEAVGYHNVFFLTGLMLLAASFVVMIFVKEPRPEPKPAISMKESFGQLKPLYPVFLASIITQIGMMSIEPFVSLYAKTLYTGTHIAIVAGFVVAASGVANLIGAPTLGRLGDRITQRRVLILALCAAAVMYIPQALAPNIYVLIAGRFGLGLFIGGMIPSLNVLVKKLAPKHLQATAFGFNSSSTFTGNLIGPLIGGWVAASYGFRDVFFVTMTFLVLNAIVIFFNRRLDVRPPLEVHEYNQE